jgi:2-keto-4-pentenoate hydratase/2-oxohepta-3-ene-1,7-dioic acid hydratase in catechol pathway
MGPVLVTPDEFGDPDDIALACSVNGVEVQRSSTADLIFSVGELVAYLSGVLELLPGDVILTGTPSGVGMGQDPPRYLQEGDVVTSWVDGVGGMTTRFRAPGR